MALKQSTGKRIGVTIVAWVVAFLIFFPILWTFITSFKSEIDAIAMPPKFLFFNWTLENYFAGSGAIELSEVRLQFDRAVDRRQCRRPPHRRSGGLVDGVCARQAHQGPVDVDALDQDDAGGRRAGADLFDISQFASAR